MKSTFSVIYYLKRQVVKKDGTVPVMGRITVDGSQTQFSCKLTVDPKLWDTKGGRVTGRSTAALETNRMLDKMRVRINKHYQEIMERDNFVTAEKVKNAFLGLEHRYHTLMQVFRQHNEDYEKQVEAGMKAKGTLAKYRTVYKHLQEFLNIRYHVKDIALKELTPAFISDFEMFLRTDKHCCTNTVWLYVCPLRTMVFIAINNEWLTRDPFREYEIKKEETVRSFLTKEEIRLLMEGRLKNAKQELYRDLYLFCAFTGLSFADMRNLTEENIHTYFDEHEWININRQEIYNQYLIQRGGKYAWEAIANPDLKISDLDEHAVISAVRGGIRSGRLPEATIREDLPTILEKFSLLHDGKLNNASAVLFGHDFYYYPQCLLRLARFKGTTKDEFIDNQRVTGNIYALLDAAMAFFFKHLSLSGKIEGLYREEELEIPYKALRECCTNALCHRLYHRPGSSVGIAIYDDRVEIENSGTFPPDITMEKLLSGHNSEPQNLIIANVLYKSEVLESWGRGIGLMISECRRVGIPDPEFHTDGNSVWVVFRYTRKAVGSYPTVTPQSPDSYPTVTPQVGKVLSAIGNQTLSTKDVMEMIGLKDKSNFLELYLYPAIRLDLVEPIYPEKPKHPRQKYRLTEKGLDLIKNK